MKGNFNVNEKMASAPDDAFRARAVHQAKTVINTVSPHAALDGAKVLDFGCGQGIALASLALRYPASHFFGADILPIDQPYLSSLLTEQVGVGAPTNIKFDTIIPGRLPSGWDNFDVIYSWSVFEHIHKDHLVGSFEVVKEALAPEGLFFLQINPLYFSPYGGHTKAYAAEPWAHLSNQLDEFQRIILEAELPMRRRLREWDQFITLNRLVAKDFVDAGTEAGLVAEAVDVMECKQDPPPFLQEIYRREALVTEELRVIFRRP